MFRYFSLVSYLYLIFTIHTSIKSFFSDINARVIIKNNNLINLGQLY